MREIRLVLVVFALSTIIILSGGCGTRNTSELPPSDASDADTTDDMSTSGEATEKDSDADIAPLDATEASINDSDAETSTFNPNQIIETDGATYVSGWTSSDGGLVMVQDGGITIEEEDGTIVICYQTTCDGRILECGDCQDNDGDRKSDFRDPECLGPCDNTEGSALISGVGGVTGSTCHVDCYFDYGNGPGTGSDDCWWDHSCDPLEPEAPLCLYDAQAVKSQKMCPDQQSDSCSTNCLPFTPNGCDCFGCCTFPELANANDDGTDMYVWIGNKDEDNLGTCTFKDINNPEKCPPCTPVPNCLNECGACEVCVGRPVPPEECIQIPVDKADAGSVVPDGGVVVKDQCPEGITPCGLLGQAICDPGYYCISGCCIENILM